MSNVPQSERVQDADIRRLNHVGLSQKAIAEELGCHPATVAVKLKTLGIKSVDTRHSFMEAVYKGLNRSQQEWLSRHLYNNDMDLRKFVSDLVVQAYKDSDHLTQAVPVPVPKLEVAAPKEKAPSKLFGKKKEEAAQPVPPPTEPKKKLFGKK